MSGKRTEVKEVQKRKANLIMVVIPSWRSIAERAEQPAKAPMPIVVTERARLTDVSNLRLAGCRSDGRHSVKNLNVSDCAFVVVIRQYTADHEVAAVVCRVHA